MNSHRKFEVKVDALNRRQTASAQPRSMHIRARCWHAAKRVFVAGLPFFLKLEQAMAAGPAASAGEGREAALDWSSPWAAWVTMLLLACAFVYALFVYFRERANLRWWQRSAFAVLRFTLFALVIFMLYRMVLRPYKTDLPDVVILVDDSTSMDFVDPLDDPKLAKQIEARVKQAGFDEASRINLAKTLLLERNASLLEQLKKRYNVKVYYIGASARLADTGDTLDAALREHAASQPESRLGRSLLEVLHAQRGRPTAAVLLFSDGITTEGRTLADAAETARRKAVPLFLVGLGNQKPLKDVWLSDLLADELAYVGDVVTFDFKASASGFEGEKIDVRLKEKATGRELDRTSILFTKDGRTESGRLRMRPPEAGDFEYEIEIISPKGESNVHNNTKSHTVKVRDETIRVLLVQAYPNYEFRYLKSLLGRQLKVSDGEEVGDPAAKSIELTTVLQSASPEYTALDATARRVFPVRREELFEYDVIIFGDVNPSLLSLSVMNNLADFVKERGGGVIFFSGPRYTPLAYQGTPLADLLPINLSQVTLPDARKVLTDAHVVQPTSLGLASPHMQLGDTPAETLERWQRLPGLYWILEAPELKPAARVLAEHPALTGIDGRNLPVIVTQYVGAGKVVFHATDETWRWRFRTGDALFGRYWIQTIRYLSRSKLLGQSKGGELTTDRKTYRRGEVVNLRMRFLDERLAPAQDDGVTLVIEQDGGRNRRVLARRSGDRGVFETTLASLGPGKYRAWLATPSFKEGAPTIDFEIEDPGGENTKLRMDEKDLRAAAQRSGGKYYTFPTALAALNDLPPGRQVPIESLEPEPIWNSPWLALIFVGLLVTEWLLRKRAGML